MFFNNSALGVVLLLFIYFRCPLAVGVLFGEEKKHSTVGGTLYYARYYISVPLLLSFFFFSFVIVCRKKKKALKERRISGNDNRIFLSCKKVYELVRSGPLKPTGPRNCPDYLKGE